MVEPAKQGETLNALSFDLVRTDGRLVLGVQADQPPDAYDGVAVVAVLSLGRLYRLPWLGPILRNHWAKRRGAIFDPSWFAAFSRP